MVGRIILTPADLEEGADWLVKAEPRFAPALALGPLPLRRWPEGFGALLDAIIGQQVSLASAAAIKARMQAAGLMEETAVAQASDEDLRAAGLSRQKARYASALAQARLDYAGLAAAPDRQVIDRLVALPGIGLWTAEIYAMFSLGRADVFAPGDLALQEAARGLFGLDLRPKEKELRAMSEAWSPWRSIAARALWAYYRAMKGREGISG
ncbi:DNA-3-methyladenine glycosylase 2 family protein [Xinfangfangia sp. CPCC 101601]|uniref:DNA-3-methyladenine glycosylase II n=1 Tax=Pseudogemmobacter lacusdianii TaxID=3069608 RepID=A0ABU0VUZ0_9RHOB|nr:DNA-3-methyladenine glycosylase 2 family protein [Xinfangfangia sp. CPCC 101601]MDQ2065561.1 DNA-3-methyladenine glycosylase 2 family protein [Xinfangfangia sp. CPCC 101601]